MEFVSEWAIATENFREAKRQYQGTERELEHLRKLAVNLVTKDTPLAVFTSDNRPYAIVVIWDFASEKLGKGPSIHIAEKQSLVYLDNFVSNKKAMCL